MNERKYVFSHTPIFTVKDSLHYLTLKDAQ